VATPVRVAAVSTAGATVAPVLAAVSFSHMLNDTIQSLLPAIYPILKTNYSLSFSQVGLLTLTLMATASVLQPLVGLYTDQRATPYSLVYGMTFSLFGLLLLSVASRFGMLLVAAGLIGVGSAVFHPESSRVARMASGGRHGLAQSVFQVGGNVGSSLGPLLAAFLVLPRGQSSIAWASGVALLAIAVLWKVGRWSSHQHRKPKPAHDPHTTGHPHHHVALSESRVRWSIVVLIALIFSKYFYLASLTNYYTFYLISHFNVSVQAAQIDLFIFLGAVAAGTILGGPIGDRFGRKLVIWVSILGVFPFTFALPFAGLFWTRILTIVIGLILASAFSAIVVYAQELMPGRIGLISGLFFGFAFGMGGLGAAVLGWLADATSIVFVYRVCAYLPLIGLLTGFLPDISSAHQRLQVKAT
jgi:FSR family fosmidomycin resistance protein-like MFS transporter